MKITPGPAATNGAIPDKRFVLLIRPHYIVKPEGRGRPMLSLSLLCLGAALQRAGYAVKLVDAPSQPDYLERVRALASDCLFAGITAMTTQVPDGLAIARVIRECAPHLPIVWGGVHPSLFPEQTCDGKNCDIVATGEGDETIVELAEAIDGKRDMAAVAGLVYRDRQNLIQTTGNRPLADIRSLPRPAYELHTSEEIRLLSATTELAIGNAIFVHAGRGCPYRCSFCINTVHPASARRHRTRAAEAILDDVVFLQAHYDVQTFLIQDEDFFADRRRVRAFLNGIVARHLAFFWQTSARANYFGIHYINKDLLAEMTGLGLTVLGVGAESGSDKTLKLLKKDTTVEQIRNAVRISKGHNFRLVLSYMIGLPGEARSEMLKTIREMDYLDRIASNLYLGGPYPFRPYPGSELFQKLEKHSLPLPQTLELWNEAAQSFEGFLEAGRFPWIEQPALVLYFAQVIPFIFVTSRVPARSLKGKLRQLLGTFFHFLIRVRLRNACWGFPLEMRLFTLIAKFR